jgi:hypothetical protein
MSKLLLNLLLQISKTLVNSKNQFLIQKFRPTLRPTRPLSPASPLATPSPADRKRPAGPSSLRVGHVFTGNMFSFSDHAFPSRPPPPSVTATRAPLVSFVVSPVSIDPGRNFPPRRRSPAPLPRALDAPELLQLSLITYPS